MCEAWALGALGHDKWFAPIEVAGPTAHIAGLPAERDELGHGRPLAQHFSVLVDGTETMQSSCAWREKRAC